MNPNQMLEDARTELKKRRDKDASRTKNQDEFVEKIVEALSRVATDMRFEKKRLFRKPLLVPLVVSRKGNMVKACFGDRFIEFGFKNGSFKVRPCILSQIENTSLLFDLEYCGSAYASGAFQVILDVLVKYEVVPVAQPGGEP